MITPEIRVDCPDEIKFKVVDTVKDELKKDHPIIDVDGVRVQFGDGWGLVRASNTQPVLVLRFEALNGKAAGDKVPGRRKGGIRRNGPAATIL